MRIAVVNDVPLASQILCHLICQHLPVELAWTARDGQEAIEKSRADCPDLILMDLVMPKMDGVEATRQIMRTRPTAILIVTASRANLDPRVFEALGAGALDVAELPILGDSANSQRSLLEKIQTIGRLLGYRLARKPLRLSPSQVPLVAIGSSSGGPAALATILAGLPATFPASLVVIQHIDPSFAPGLADWLQTQTSLKVQTAQTGDIPTGGIVYLAGGRGHLVLSRSGCLSYQIEPSNSPHRPSVDVFLESLARHWKGRAAGIILTGMGCDGAAGLLAMRARQFTTWAQDRASSAIYGMPKAATQNGAAAKVLSLQRIAPQLLTLFSE